MSLAIYPVTLDVVRGVQPLIQQIKREDPNLADQLRRAVTSIPLNVSEGSYSQGKNCRARFFNALGSAGEVRACLDVAEAMRYVDTIDAGLRDRLDHVIATLYRLTLR
ncbi:MAG: four helix bundle protein [Polyangiaceae bacterium]|nr:four helix bundle protein [Polyangiaceae bacterium]